jgi:drug/metabolite transporter (DMT)-like permease
LSKLKAFRALPGKGGVVMAIFQRRWFANMTLLLIAFVWGATFTFTKDALASIDVFPFLSMRFLIAGLVLFIVVLASPRVRNSFHPRAIIIGILLGVLLFGGYAFQTLGLQTITPAMSGFLTGLNVVLIPILSIPLLRSKPTFRLWLGTLVAIVGLACISGVHFNGFNVGDIETLLCSALIALQIIFVEKSGSDVHALLLATIEILVVALCCFICSMFEHPDELWNVHLWLQPSVLWAVLINAILGTSFALWEQNVIQKYTSSTQIAIIFSMEPVFAGLIAWFALGDTLTPMEFMGSLLIFVSMFIAEPSIP